MARDLNQVFLIGRLVKDPEIKYTSSGTPVTKFSIANNSTFTQNNDKKEYVNYFDVNVWGNQAVTCEKYLKKGKQVAIVGVLRQNRWNDKTSGQTKSKVEITAFSIQFLTPMSGAQNIPLDSEQETIKKDKTVSNEAITSDPWGDNWSNEEVNPFETTTGDDDIPF
ncbi:MAG: single-stranded DNA-binding protein [Spirochaetes bacterium]|nr:single-stranded DNA-binding protein [Spirochaetota bacterium]